MRKMRTIASEARIPVMIEVYAIGTQVTIDGDIPATIRAVTIYSTTWVKYLCVWWEERQRREEWLSGDEIQAQNHEPQTIKFV